MPSSPKIVLMSKEPERYLRVIRVEAPDADIVLCDTYDGLKPLLDQHRPEVVLTNKVEPRPFPRADLFGCESVRWVQAASAGVDYLMPWDPKRVSVTNASGIHVEIMAEQAIAHMLNFSLGLRQFAEQQRAKIWKNRPLASVVGKTLVIAGFGKIGQGLGIRARALGMKVIGLRTKPEPSPAADEVWPIAKLKDAVAIADFVALTMPLTSETRGLFSADMLKAFKPGARLINLARGGIVDEAALIQCLKSGHIADAAFDVFATEPLPAESPFWDLPNAVVTPHTGDPEDWEGKVAEIFCRNLKLFRAGKPLFNVVDPAKGY